MQIKHNPWKEHDLHRHSLDNLPISGNLPSPGFGSAQRELLEQNMETIFLEGAEVQAVTDHSHDLVRTQIPWGDYLGIFYSAPTRPGQEKLLGMELNVRSSQGEFFMDYDTICDRQGAKLREIAKHIDFVILSLHDHYYGKDGMTRMNVHIPDIQTYYSALLCTIHLSGEIRGRFARSKGAGRFKGGIPVVLGHSWKRAAEKGWRKFTEEEVRNIAVALYDFNVFPEINHVEILEGSSDTLNIGKSVLGHYIAYGFEEGFTPLVSVGTDWHQRKPEQHGQDVELPDWVISGLKDQGAKVWYDALKQP